MPGTYLPSNYLGIAFFLLVAIGFCVVSLGIGYFVRPLRPYDEKKTIYESGVDPIGEPRQRFAVKYYIIAMLFVVFDVEAIFLYPWAISFMKIGIYAFIEMVLFIVVLLIGYFYAWNKGAFEWDK
jgi:NADH-quinone oxidoreductase subunit A